MPAKTKSQLIAELAALQQRVAQLEIEQQNREADLARWLVAERERWALAEALRQTGASIGSTLRGEEVLDRILEEMSRVVACDAACLLLIEGELARIYRWRGYIRSRRATAQDIVSAAFKIESIPVLRAVQETRRPLVVARPANNEAWVRKFGTTWVKSYGCAPIRSRGKVIGFLVVDSEVPGFFELTDAEPLQAFADQAAMALENVGYHDRTRDEIVTRLRTFKKERNFISAVLDTADALVIALDREGRIVHFNRACEQISGYNFAEVKNHYLWDLLSLETAASAQNYFTELTSGSPFHRFSELPAKFESYLVTKTGQQRLIAWSNTTLPDKTGVIEYVIATGVDITQRQQAEAALQANEALLRTTFEQVAVGITCATMDGKFFQANDRFCQMLGYSRDEILTMSIADVTHPDDLDADLAYMDEINVGKRNSFALEKRYVRKDGRLVWVNLSVSLVHLPANGLKYAVGVVEDITERKQIEEELRRNHNFLQTLMDNLPVSIFVKSAEDGRFVLWNKATEQLMGITSAAALGRTDYDFFPKEQADFFRQKDREVFEKRLRIDIPQEPLDSQNLGRRILHTIKTPIYDASNTPLYLLAISEDITERVQSEAALRESEATKKAILQAIPDLMFRNSQDGTYLDYNAPQATDLLLPPDQFLGRKIREVLPPDLAQQYMNHVEQLFQTGKMQSFEYQLSLQDQIRHFEARLVRSGLDETLTIVRDITERKQAEEALRQSEQRLELALMGADLGLWDLNVQTSEDITDQRAAEMLGYTPTEVEPHLDWWDKRTHPEDMLRIQAAWDTHLARITPFYECEYRLQTKSGEWKWIWIEAKWFKEMNMATPFDLRGLYLDITERKQAEEALRAQNEQLQARNRELDAYARTVAHDLRNPLGALTGIAEILHEDYIRIPPEKLGEYLESIARSGRRASRIVEDLLLLAGVRQQTVKLQPLDMSSLVDEALQRLASMIADYQAKIITPTVWPAAIGFAPWIEEVWVNYLSNGLKYGGQPPLLELGATVQEDGMLRFWVKDNGPGLTPESQAKLFTEFTQLEPDRADGYGLGLSIVRRIVEKLGGQVGVESDGVPSREAFLVLLCHKPVATQPDYWFKAVPTKQLNLDYFF